MTPLKALQKAREQSDGWIEHVGHGMPVPYGTVVDVIHSRGRTVLGREAHSFEWRPGYSSDPISAYRLHTPTSPEPHP